METALFLKSVVTTAEGYFNLSTRVPDSKEWQEHWYEWPKDLDNIVQHAAQVAKQQDVYFSSHLFEIKNSHKANVLPTRTIQADLDNAVLQPVNTPNILVETSPNRHQGFWILGLAPKLNELESLSKQLTYSIRDADRSGWPLGHRMRLPNTLNHKYNTGPKEVRIISAILDKYSDIKIPKGSLLYEVDNTISSDEWVPEKLTEVGPRELWTTIKRLLPRKVQSQYDARQQDRSIALWTLLLSLFRAGLTRDQVYWIARDSANNKFKDNKFHGDLDLAKDVLRAEIAIKRGDLESNEDVRISISEARHLPGIAFERRAFIAAIVRDTLIKQGAFIATNDGQEWYVREDTGRPILLVTRNEYLDSMLDIRFGLNATEQEQKFVVKSLMSSTKESGLKGITGSLCYYDPSQRAVLLHTGRRDVLHITKDLVSPIANGQMNLVFPFRPNEDPFDPDIEHATSIDHIFDGFFHNLNEMPRDQAIALVKAWFYFLFFRNVAVGRPILFLTGQPGSSKSSWFRLIYTLLYGQDKSLNSVTTADDFDYAVATDPLVVFDNVDTYINWLPDKLALSASTSDLVKRKLYTDTDIITLKRQAMVGITAHNPRFRREDIVDRLLIISLHRLPTFKPETEIINYITTNRDKLWGGIVKDIQRILATPEPIEAELPRFRVSDFARIGLRIARALGFEDSFIAALNSNIKEQFSFNLEEEDSLVESIRIWMTRPFYDPAKFYSTGQLWTVLQSVSRDPQNFSKSYKSAIVLGKKLWSMQNTLQSILDIEFAIDETGSRVWKISKK